MSPTMALPEPGHLYHAFEREEAQLRRQYLSIDLPSSQEHVAAEAVIKDSARYLELLATSVCLHEILDELGARSVESMGQSSEETVGQVKQACGLDLVQVARDNAALLSRPDRGEAVALPIRMLVRVTRSLLELCPIHSLSHSGRVEALTFR